MAFSLTRAIWLSDTKAIKALGSASDWTFNAQETHRLATANEEGVISGATRWLSRNQMFNEGYEDLFAVDFIGNSDIGI